MSAKLSLWPATLYHELSAFSRPEIPQPTLDTELWNRMKRFSHGGDSDAQQGPVPPRGPLPPRMSPLKRMRLPALKVTKEDDDSKTTTKKGKARKKRTVLPPVKPGTHVPGRWLEPPPFLGAPKTQKKL